MTTNKLLSIIIPSYKDERILAAIKSVRSFDDLGIVKVIVVDGDSGSEFCESLSAVLESDDVLISEADEGIFDGLNKGLDRVDTPYLGWLGSDDFYSDEVKASDVIYRLQDADLFIGDLLIFSHTKIKRRTFSRFSNCPIALRLGLHNPHYATFGRASTLKKYRFSVTSKAADIGYFLNVFSEEIRVKTTSKIVVFQAEGGFSNTSVAKVLEVNLEASKFYGALSPIALSIKLLVKLLSICVYRLHPRFVPPQLVGAYLESEG